MKKILFIIILISKFYSSSISLGGFGNDNSIIDAASAALGNSSLFSGRVDGVVQSAMATQYNSPLTKISLSKIWFSFTMRPFFINIFISKFKYLFDF